MSGLVVTAGPSLRATDRARYPEIRFVCPASDGDVLKVCAARPAAIGIVDGMFREQLPIGHKEILWALSEGIPVYGAASIGALRAVELERYGMIGVGEIFEAYRSGEMIADSDVALVHGPEHLGHPPLTLALVDVAATVRTLRYTGRLVPATADAVMAAARDIHFSERSWEAVVGRVGTPADPALLELLAAAQVERKRLDAAMLLDRMVKDHRAGLPCRPRCPRPPITPAFGDTLRRAGIKPPST